MGTTTLWCHPQSIGQAEWANQDLESSLRCSLPSPSLLVRPPALGGIRPQLPDQLRSSLIPQSGNQGCSAIGTGRVNKACQVWWEARAALKRTAARRIEDPCSRIPGWSVGLAVVPRSSPPNWLMENGSQVHWSLNHRPHNLSQCLQAQAPCRTQGSSSSPIPSETSGWQSSFILFSLCLSVAVFFKFIYFTICILYVIRLDLISFDLFYVYFINKNWTTHVSLQNRKKNLFSVVKYPNDKFHFMTNLRYFILSYSGFSS